MFNKIVITNSETGAIEKQSATLLEAVYRPVVNVVQRNDFAWSEAMTLGVYTLTAGLYFGAKYNDKVSKGFNKISDAKNSFRSAA